MPQLGVAPQTICKRVKAGQLASYQVTCGHRRGLYVRLPDQAALRLFESQLEERSA